MNQLPTEFYARPARLVAQALLGKTLVRMVNGRRLSGVIVETEAYCDADKRDLACHGDKANGGQPTPRTAVMFGPAGYSYVYFTYGIHWMFNVVTGETDQANAVLIRALEPVDGIDVMTVNRKQRPAKEVTNGPGKLAQALAIDKSLNAANLCTPNRVLWIEYAPDLPPNQIGTGPRIGLGKTPEPWFSAPWRYWVQDNPFVSR